MSIAQLPPELLLQIFFHLSPLEFFGSVAAVCRHWDEVTRSALPKIPVEVALTVSDLMHDKLPVTAVVTRPFKRFKLVRGVVGGEYDPQSPSARPATKLAIAKISLFVPSHLLHTTPIFKNLARVVEDATIRSAPRVRLIRRGLDPVPTAVDVMAVNNPVVSNAGGSLVGFARQFSARFSLRTVMFSLDLIATWIREGLPPVHSVVDATIYWISASRSSELVFADPFVVFPNLRNLRLGTYQDSHNTKLLQAVADYKHFSAPESLLRLQTHGFNCHLPTPSWPIVLAQLLSRFPNVTGLGDLVLFDDSNDHWGVLAAVAPELLVPGFTVAPTPNGWVHEHLRDLSVAICPRWYRNDMGSTSLLASFSHTVARYFPAVESVSFRLSLQSPFKPLFDVQGAIAAWDEVLSVLPAKRITFVGDHVELLLRKGKGVARQVSDTWGLFFLAIHGIGDRLGKKVEVGEEF